VKVRYCDGASFTGDGYNQVSTITCYIVNQSSLVLCVILIENIWTCRRGYISGDNAFLKLPWKNSCQRVCGTQIRCVKSDF
jgi:hypothetical protein